MALNLDTLGLSATVTAQGLVRLITRQSLIH